MSGRRRGADEVAGIGLGLCTPLGLTARATQVEMAAGTVRFFETDVLDNAGEPVRASVLTLLEPGLTRTERMTALAVTALQESIKGSSAHRMEQLPLFLALPEPGSGAPFDSKAVLKALDAAAAPLRLELSEGALHPEGRAGFFRALADASLLLKARKASCVLVGGVDSMCDRGSLALHARAGRSLGEGTRDGILPGEGAGFFLLTSGKPPGQWRLPPLGWFIGYALSHEARSFLQRKPNLAEGLTAVFRQLQRHPWAGTQRVDHVLSSQTGETFWAQEFNYAYLRNAQMMPEPLIVNLIAESLGDAGAAAGAVQAGYALHLLRQQKKAPGAFARILVYGCADAGQVGACILEGGS